MKFERSLFVYLYIRLSKELDFLSGALIYRTRWITKGGFRAISKILG
jgi:hypothetical protein